MQPSCGSQIFTSGKLVCFKISPMALSGTFEIPSVSGPRFKLSCKFCSCKQLNNPIPCCHWLLSSHALSDAPKTTSLDIECRDMAKRHWELRAMALGKNANKLKKLTWRICTNNHERSTPFLDYFQQRYLVTRQLHLKMQSYRIIPRA